MTPAKRRFVTFGVWWLPVYLVAFLGFGAALVSTDFFGGSLADGPPPWFLALFGLHAATIVLGLTTMVLLVLDALHRDDLRGTDERLIWVLVLALTGPVGSIAYWWMHVRVGRSAPSSP